MWILIIIMLGYNTGMSVESVEFNDLKSCEIAREHIARRFNDAEVDYMLCTPKNTQSLAKEPTHE